MSRRLFDITFAAFGLVLLAAPLAVIALLLKIFTHGPVIYRQQRVGRGGRLFLLYKFRTMESDESGSKVTTQGDHRITRIGQVMRVCKLDELPQLWNVLKGEMSVIGPRPEVERFVRHYTAEQRRVLQVTPGLAGLSQLVYPHESELLARCSNPEEAYVRHLLPRKVAVDLEYETNRTLWSDLKLMSEVMLLILGRAGRIDRSFQMPSALDEPAVSARGSERPAFLRRVC